MRIIAPAFGTLAIALLGASSACIEEPPDDTTSQQALERSTIPVQTLPPPPPPVTCPADVEIADPKTLPILVYSGSQGTGISTNADWSASFLVGISAELEVETELNIDSSMYSDKHPTSSCGNAYWTRSKDGAVNGILLADCIGASDVTVTIPYYPVINEMQLSSNGTFTAGITTGGEAFGFGAQVGAQVGSSYSVVEKIRNVDQRLMRRLLAGSLREATLKMPANSCTVFREHDFKVLDLSLPDYLKKQVGEIAPKLLVVSLMTLYADFRATVDKQISTALEWPRRFSYDFKMDDIGKSMPDLHAQSAAQIEADWATIITTLDAFIKAARKRWMDAARLESENRLFVGGIKERKVEFPWSGWFRCVAKNDAGESRDISMHWYSFGVRASTDGGQNWHREFNAGLWSWPNAEKVASGAALAAQITRAKIDIAFLDRIEAVRNASSSAVREALFEGSSVITQDPQTWTYLGLALEVFTRLDLGSFGKITTCELKK